MGLLSRVYAAAGNNEMENFINNFHFELEGLPCRSFYWPLSAVSMYVVMVILSHTYNGWSRKRSLQALSAAPSTDKSTVACAHAAHLTVEEFAAAMSVSLDDATRRRALLKNTPFKRLMVRPRLGAAPLGTLHLTLLASHRLQDLVFGIHNYVLCGISLVMLLGAGAAVVDDWVHRGFLSVYCNDRRGEVVFWSYIFYVTKFYELLDTFFLILRGNSLQSLHVIHHGIVPFLFWMYLLQEFTGQWVQVTLNCAVHVVMYHYFGTMTLQPGRKLWWRKYITVMQIVQFVIDMVGTLPWLVIPECIARVDEKPYGWECLYSGYSVGILFCFLFGKILVKSFQEPARKAGVAPGEAKKEK